MNAGNKYLANPKVREAIAYGIDYKGIEKTIMGPYGRARNVPVPEISNMPSRTPIGISTSKSPSSC